MERLKLLAKQFSLELTDLQINQFQQYYEMLIEKNKVMNLTTITELEDVITKHFLDSVAVSKIRPFFVDENLSVLDLGTGAGFPGIPLKIVFPQLKITLMDSLNKRVLFLQSVIDELGLSNIEAVHGRAEEAARNSVYREQFDLCVSRAVANLSTLSEYCLPFVKVGGHFISYKAADLEDEVNAAKKAVHVLGGAISSVEKLMLPQSEIERAFVVIDKVSKTPKAYPRKAGTASKDPIH